MSNTVPYLVANNVTELTFAVTDPYVLKVLLCAIDPLIDISVAFPDLAYTTE